MLFLAILNAIIAIALMIARQFFSTGRDNVWPRLINYALTRIHKRFHSPWIATLTLGVFGIAACFIKMNVLFLIACQPALIVIYAALCVFSCTCRQIHNEKTKHAYYRMPLFPLPPVIGLLAVGYIIYANALDEAVGRPSLLVTLGIIILSAAYYFFVLRRRDGWELRGPVDLPD